MPTLKSTDALLIVDPQNDFFPEGALPVPDGDKILPILNEWINYAEQSNVPILVSRDWHPKNHCSFKIHGGIWPVHCVQNTKGAKFHSELKLPENTHIINKAFEPQVEAYSPFEGGQLTSGEALETYLKQKGILRLWVGGLALDYCVKATVIDAVEKGFEVNLILSATKAISQDTAKDALHRMKEKGVHFV